MQGEGAVEEQVGNAASIAGLLITTEAMIAEKPQRADAGRGMSDMGGMM